MHLGAKISLVLQLQFFRERLISFLSFFVLPKQQKKKNPPGNIQHLAITQEVIFKVMVTKATWWGFSLQADTRPWIMAWPGVLLTKQDTENYRRRQKKYAACDRHLHKQPREVTASVVRGGWIFQVSKDRFVRNDIINQTCCLSIQEEPNCCCCPEDWEAWAGCLPRPTGKPPGQMEQAPWYHHAGAHSRPDSIAKLCNH